MNASLAGLVALHAAEMRWTSIAAGCVVASAFAARADADDATKSAPITPASIASAWHATASIPIVSAPVESMPPAAAVTIAPSAIAAGASDTARHIRSCQPSGPEVATRSCSALEGFVITWPAADTVAAFVPMFAPALRTSVRRWLAVHGISASGGANQGGIVAGLAAAF